MYLTGFADEAGKEIKTQIKATKELGWSNIELRATGFSGDLAAMTDAEFDEFCGILLPSGVKINCFGSGIANWGKDVSLPFEDTKKEVMASIPRMQKIGCKMVRIMSYAVRKDPASGLPLRDSEQDLPERIKRLDYIIKTFNDAGILPVHENCMNYGGMSWKHTLQLIEKLPELKLVYDTGNPTFTADMALGKYEQPVPRQDAFEFYKQVKKHIAYMHIKDASGEAIDRPGEVFPTVKEYTYPGEGVGKVREIMKDLMDSGYDGGISMEPHLKVVFHEAEGENEADAKYNSYVEYGKRFMKLMADIGYPCKA